MIDALGTCITGRGKQVENHLDLTCLQVKTEGNLVDVLWWKERLIVCSAMGDILVINPNTASKECTIQVPLDILSIELLEGFETDLLIETTVKTYYKLPLCLNSTTDVIYTQQSDIINTLKSETYIPTHLRSIDSGSLVKVQIFEGRTVLTVLNQNIFRLYEAGNLYKPTLEIEVQNRLYHSALVHHKVVFLFSRCEQNTRIDMYSLIATRPKVTNDESLSIDHTRDNEKVCICDDFTCRQVRDFKVFDYKKWLDYTPSHPLEINSWIIAKEVLVSSK